MKATVDLELCIGCGLCPTICEEVFEMGDDDLAHAHAQVTDDIEEAVTEARDSCPVDAISIDF